MQNPNYQAGYKGQRGTYTDIHSIAYRTGVRDREAMQKPLFAPPKQPIQVFTPVKNVSRPASYAPKAAVISPISRPIYSSSAASYVDTDTTGYSYGSSGAFASSWLAGLVRKLMLLGVIGGLIYGAYRYISAPSAKPAIASHPHIGGKVAHHKQGSKTVRNGHETNKSRAVARRKAEREWKETLAKIPDAAPSR